MKQKIQQNYGSYEPDSSPAAWKYYKGYAEDILIGKTFKPKGSNRLKSKAKFKGMEFEVAGDCSFNFKLGRKYFENIIRETLKDEDASNLIAELKYSAYMHHELPNFALMPVAGGLNNLKGNLKIKNGKVMVHDIGKRPTSALDRMDTFLYFLDYSLNELEYFNNQGIAVDLREAGVFFSESIFTTSMKGENFPFLYDLLTSFEDIYEYCETFYGLKRGNEEHKELIDKLIKNGNQPITSVKDVVRYIKLANTFWKARRFDKLNA